MKIEIEIEEIEIDGTYFVTFRKSGELHRIESRSFRYKKNAKKYKERTKEELVRRYSFGPFPKEVKFV